MIYARIDDNDIVLEVFTPPEGFTLQQCFTAEIAAEFVDVTSASPGPRPGWVGTKSGSTWESFSAPPPVPPG